MTKELLELKLLYEEYKHLDDLLSDEEWMGDNQVYRIACEMWQVVKKVAMTLKGGIKIENDRWCIVCGEQILNTNEIYDPKAINPLPPPIYFEFCPICFKKMKGKGKVEYWELQGLTESQRDEFFKVIKKDID